jgi:cation/acetate symporter
MAQRVRDIQADPAEAQSKAIMHEKLAELDRKIADPEQARFAERQLLGTKIAELKQQNSPVRDIQRLEANPVWHDNDSQRLVQAWQRERSQIQHELQRAIGFERGTAQDSQNGLLNTLCLVLCFMMGTASLPHVLMRSLTTPTAQQAQKSIVWTLVWVAIVYLCASSLAVMIKQVVLTDLVGSAMNALPEWAQQLRLRKPALLTLNDHNGDGLVQWADVRLATDYLVLAVPEILGISAVFTGLIAAGALAAALSTADGLLLTISNALAHDMYFQTLAPKATPIRRVMLSKILLMLVALVAAWIATYRPVDILFWVSCAFSLAASCFFPVLLLSLYWPGFSRAGAIAAMVCGTVLALWYIGAHSLAAMGLGSLDGLWWGVAPVSAGVFGVPTGLVAGIVASKIWPVARAAPTPAAS